jgi:hypothetical protein
LKKTKQDELNKEMKELKFMRREEANSASYEKKLRYFILNKVLL